MSITEPLARTVADRYELAAVDLYRDIHKGIRGELFAAVTQAGRLDPGDGQGRVALAAQVRDLVRVLVSHAEHEDGAIQPVLEQELPDLAAEVAADHERLEGQMDQLVALGDAAVEAPADDQRRSVAALHLELASFTSQYLTHQDVEERIVMPAIEAVIGVGACLALHQQIVGAIPPEEMAQSLAFMIPAMNLEDRTEMLGGMQAGAPPEVFREVWGLVCSVLPAADVQPLATRLGVR